MPARFLLSAAVVLLAYGFFVSSNFKDIAAGVALFLFGMLCMEQGFKAFSGGSLKRMLRASTDTLWKSLSFGLVTTTLTQSSSLVSVITISFLSAEMISLAQGIGVVFGANLGTTTGAWIVAGFGLKVNISAYAMPMLVFGVLFLMQSSSRTKGFGWILVGVGFLFLGIHYMKDGFSAYAEHIDLTRYALPGVTGLLVFTLIGIVATVVMQSSHATVTLTITALAAGQLTYENALALAIGANVGTTVTAAIAAIGASISGKRLAGAHLVFNLVTGVVALLMIRPLLAAVEHIAAWVGIGASDYTLKLAMFHTLFNLLGVILMVPFIPRMVTWLETHLRSKYVERDQPRYLSEASLELPEVACRAVLKETLHLVDNAYTLVAHGVNLTRSEIQGDSDLTDLLNKPVKLIDIDLDDQYLRMIKDIYSANIEFISRAQGGASVDDAASFAALRVANMETVAAIKATKHLRSNLQHSLRSGNPLLRREYNRLRIRVGGVLRELAALRESEDPVVTLLSLDPIRVSAVDAAEHAASRVDELIRERRITSQMATSLINDGIYTRELIDHMLNVTEAVSRAVLPAGDTLSEKLSLQLDEIADIARSMDGGADPQD